MRFVPDTNILVSAVFGKGLCDDIIRAGIVRRQICLSEYILDELQRVLPQKHRLLTSNDAQRIANYYRLPGAVLMVQPVVVAAGICSDDKDLPVLGTAIAAQADYLITGDTHLLDLGKYHGIVIVTPRNFLKASQPSPPP